VWPFFRCRVAARGSLFSLGRVTFGSTPCYRTLYYHSHHKSSSVDGNAEDDIGGFEMSSFLIP